MVYVTSEEDNEAYTDLSWRNEMKKLETRLEFLNKINIRLPDENVSWSNKIPLHKRLLWNIYSLICDLMGITEYQCVFMGFRGEGDVVILTPRKKCMKELWCVKEQLRGEKFEK